ncbi:MAG: ParA family protein [Lysobacteraceae bacterium]
MRRILISSSKGGCGKTTLTVNLAVALAREGAKVWIIDADPQGSSSDWANARGNAVPSVGCIHSATQGSTGSSGWTLKVPADADYLLIDTPAGLRSHQLAEFLRRCDTLLAPLAPSAIDARASRTFLAELTQSPAVRNGSVRVGLVANRVKARTVAARQLDSFVEGSPFPLVASLRDSQAYVLAGEHGRGVFDADTPGLAACQQDWAPLLAWLKRTKG